MFFKPFRSISFAQNSFDRGFLSGLFAGVLFCILLFSLIALIGVVPVSSICWATIQTGSSDSNQTEIQGPARLIPIGTIRRDLKAFVKRSKINGDDSARACAIVDLCLLHQEIVNDPRFATNDQLKGFRAVAATRLKNCQKEIEVEMKRQARIANKRAASQPEHPDESTSNDDSFGSGSERREMSCQTYQEIVAREFESMSQFTGGPIRVWSHIGGSYGPQGDYGPQLVELIQSTINPDFWRANGGEGIIYYYRPSCVLVVGATAKVHDDLTDMLRTLRDMSR